MSESLQLINRRTSFRTNNLKQAPLVDNCVSDMQRSGGIFELQLSHILSRFALNGNSLSWLKTTLTLYCIYLVNLGIHFPPLMAN